MNKMRGSNGARHDHKTRLYYTQLHVPQAAVAPTVGSSKPQHLRCSQWSCCGTGLLITDTLKDCSVCTCRVKWSNTLNVRHCSPSTHQQLVTQQQCHNPDECNIFLFVPSDIIFLCLFIINPSAWSDGHCPHTVNITCRGVTGTARMLHALTHLSISQQVREQM
jgi:hypothetical protein